MTDQQQFAMHGNEDQNSRGDSPTHIDYKKMEEKLKLDEATHMMSVEFQHVFPESKGAELPARLKEIYSFAFKYLVLGLYLLLTVVIGTFVMIIYGIVLAIVTFFITWIVSPTIKSVKMCLFVQEDYMTALVSCAIAPIFRTMALCFSRVGVRYQRCDQKSIIAV